MTQKFTKKYLIGPARRYTQCSLMGPERTGTLFRSFFGRPRNAFPVLFRRPDSW